MDADAAVETAEGQIEGIKAKEASSSSFFIPLVFSQATPTSNGIKYLIHNCKAYLVRDETKPLSLLVQWE